MIVERMGRDESGVAAVEAALILPVLILLCAAMATLGDAFLQYRRAVNAAASMLNVAVEVGDFDRTTMGLSGESLRLIDHGMELAMAGSSSGAKLIVSRLTRSEDKTRVVWTTAPSDSATAQAAPAIGHGLLNGESVLMADVVVERPYPLGLWGGRLSFRTRFTLSLNARGVKARSGPRWTS